MRLHYDLHIHSCLSPCADDEMTPCNITALAEMLGLDVIAVSDHNSMLNCGAVIKAGAKLGISVLPAMELETAENVHILMLFSSLGRGMEFYREFSPHVPRMKNRPDIFGEQAIMDENDVTVGIESNMLLTASDIGVYDCAALAEKYGGVAIPAHVDRESNGLIAILGDIDDGMGFSTVEVSPNASDEFVAKLEERGYRVIQNSDAHRLESINLPNDGNALTVDAPDAATVIEMLKTKKGVHTQ